ncbi:outer membrane protein [Candidatus Finniella inopinata]|uniref:outer membrane protein n=1 Tax=Candidatus Finniella inopinata TaxID=1696036 RepID=UPI0013EEC8E0|nr:outer membrane beta-barrel protein [Candidatus Finniella inopinata]
MPFEFAGIRTLEGTHADSGLFNGFYLGGNLGGIQHHVQTSFPSIDWTVNVKDSSLNKKTAYDSLVYGLHAGYGHNFSGFYLGLEVNLEQDTSRQKATYDIETIKTGAVSYQYPTKLTTQYQRGLVLGVAPRIGAVTANDNLLYLKCSLGMSRDKVEAYHAWQEVNVRGFIIPGSGACKTVSASKRQIVFVPGIGYERAFGSMVIRLEYNYNLGAKVKTPCLMENTMPKDTLATLQYSAHVIKAGLSYQFQPKGLVIF